MDFMLLTHFAKAVNKSPQYLRKCIAEDDWRMEGTIRVGCHYFVPNKCVENWHDDVSTPTEGC